MTKKKKSDWRSLPRKPAAAKQSVRKGFRLTADQNNNLHANAAAADLSQTDYVVDRCCRLAGDGP